MAAFSLWIIATLLSTLQTDVAVVGLPTQNLHHHMTKREVEHFFGVDDHEKVPEYDIANLYKSDEQGDLSYPMHQTRNKRDTEAHEPFYKLDAFGSKLHLKLKRNDHLMAPGLTILRQNNDGTTTAHPAPENTFYLGQVASDPRSTVAVSNNGGLTGIVKTSRDTLFVQPLPAHLARRVTSNEDDTPHLVYRRSLPANHVWCETLQDEETTRLRRSVESEYVSDAQKVDSAPTNYKTLKVALMYPSSLARKYNDANLNSSIGGVENFMLLLGNIVAGFFQDPSFGSTKITYVVTQILMIDPAQYGFNPSDASGTKLNKIFRHVLRQNHAAKVPYDVFSYISDTIPGGALAFANQICRNPTGSVNKELGLQTALHLAHETGHNMYLDHDVDSCARGYIMNAVLPGGIHATEWSECSRNVIQGFLADRGRSHCLDDGPTGDRLELSPDLRDKLPGAIVNGHKQCESHYGVGWRKLQEHECAHIKCIRGGTILGRNLAAMDGTSCGHGKWCIKGKCSSTGIVVNIASVGWSNWGNYSQCTRTCGGGVQHRSRKCNSPAGSKFCKGENLQHRICNPQACPAGSRRFRDQQCDERQQGSWFYGNPTCWNLLCRSGNVVRNKGGPVDGSRCTHNVKDYSVCIRGSCRPVGCDHVLHSRIAFDLCGVCGGNGTCKRIEDTYAGNPNEIGPDNAGLIAELLPGTYNAGFDVIAFTRNVLGVQDAQGNYLVGGHLGGDQIKEAAGTVITYRRRMKRGKSRDWLQIAKVNPTNALLKVVYIKTAATSNPGVKYHYLDPVSPGDIFEWVVGNWSSCSKTCASGTRTRSRQCIRQANQSPASDAACPRPIPTTIEACNTQPCEAKWTFSKWTFCSKTCGLGIQTRTLKCLEEVNDDHFRETNSCADPKPTDPTQLDCNNYPCPTQWKPEQWSECSAKCAVGTRQRTILCSRIDAAGVLTTIDDEFCRHLDKPASEGKCNEDDPCGPRPPTCPADHLCSNGGQCKSDPSGYKCNCDRGFTGEECEIKLNPCDNNPCLNGGVCSPGVVGHHFDHTCQCTERFTGRNCETAITACVSSPCLNGAACADNGSYDQYNCTCLEGFHGKRCQVPEFHGIGCFVYKKKVILEVEELKDQLVTVAKCAEHVHMKGYKFFALGLNGKCFSGPKAGVNYFRYGATAKAKCANGVGKQGAAFAYTFDPLPAYEQVGCFIAQKGKKKKAFKIKYMDFRKQFNSQDTKTTVERCLRVAIGKGFKYFAIRDRATCWSDKNAAANYNKYGSSNECKDGVGLKNSIMVYKTKE